ncbi:MFS transporter [Nonomuraea sp. NPDC051191]|uniref:MFS transporter n=1 Tax=Nonomuraea sp. NPDC051191 TaxID=3364372 RepID=UPI00379809AA
MLLGVGAAMIMASTVAIIRTTFSDDRERAIALGVWTAVHSAGATVGPVLGGALVERWWWGAVFLVNVPLVAFALITGPWRRRSGAAALLWLTAHVAVVLLRDPGEPSGVVAASSGSTMAK